MTKESEDQDQITAGKQEEQTIFEIEGVPLLKQPNEFWCGYTTLAMVLQYWHKQGHLPDLTKDDLTPEAVFETIHEEKPDMNAEKFYPKTTSYIRYARYCR